MDTKTIFGKPVDLEKYNNLYEVDDSAMPADIQVYINNNDNHGEQVAAVRVGSPAANPCPMGHVPHVYSLVLTCEYTALKTTLLFQASTIRRLLHEVREVADLKMSFISF